MAKLRGAGSSLKHTVNESSDSEDPNDILQIQQLKKSCVNVHKVGTHALKCYCETYQRFTEREGIFPLGRIKEVIPAEVQTELKACVNREVKDDKAKQRLHAIVQAPDKRNRKAEGCWWQLDFLDLIGWFGGGGDLRCLSRTFSNELRKAERSGCQRDIFFTKLLEVLNGKEGEEVSRPFIAPSWDSADVEAALELWQEEQEGSTGGEADEGDASKADTTVEDGELELDSFNACDDTACRSAPEVKAKGKDKVREEAASVTEAAASVTAEEEDREEGREEEEEEEDSDYGSTLPPIEHARGTSASPLWSDDSDDGVTGGFGNDNEEFESQFVFLPSDNTQPRTPPRQISRSLGAGKGAKRVEFASSSPARVPAKRIRTASAFPSQQQATITISSPPPQSLPSFNQTPTMVQGGAISSSAQPQQPDPAPPPPPPPPPGPVTPSFHSAPKPADSVPIALETLQPGRLVTSAALDLVLQVFVPTNIHVADASAAQPGISVHYRPLQDQAVDRLPSIVLPIYTQNHWVMALISPSQRTCCMMDSWTSDFYHEQTQNLAMGFCNRLPGGSNAYNIQRPNDFPKQQDEISCAIMAMLDVLLRITNLSVPNAHLLDQDTIRYLFRVAICAAYPDAALPTLLALPALARPSDETQMQACQQYLQHLRARHTSAQLLELVAQYTLSSCESLPNIDLQEQALQTMQNLITLGQQNVHLQRNLPPDLAACQYRMRNESTLQRMRTQAMNQVVLQARRIRAESMPELSRMAGHVGF
ncbi:hypothetical protein AC578_7809 [Pseudocercospora eumusae]|uniref:Ubiquitin-like protease family profile domain-containing protein n=1 Tax=Pseudocercospora eumusae TaxID=321146 RepID=A0A139GTQ9_9PEZI|nr:hypothetical protein AC578_7809 [Pseudocercospora eumusae]